VYGLMESRDSVSVSISVRAETVLVYVLMKSRDSVSVSISVRVETLLT
jgi:hypothetical protein